MYNGQEQTPSSSKTHKIKQTSRSKLPTPPPDPASPTMLQDSDEVFLSSNALDYINSLKKTMFTSVIATEDAFDHLDKLYKLMEQMLELRQQNAQLLNRIRDLEHLKNLGSMHHELRATGNIQDFDDDSLFTESLLDSMLTETKKEYKNKPWARSRLAQRHTSSSDDPNPSQPSRKLSSSSGRDNTSKVSKWTKVKAAFRWEKASPSVTGAKSLDSGISGMTPINFEVARYLRVPSSDETGNSPADSGAADGSTPGSLSSASSNDDVHRQDLQRDCQTSCENRKCTPRKGMHSRRRRSLKRAQKYQSEPVSDNRSDDDREFYIDSRQSSIKQRQRRVPKVQIPDYVVERYQKAIADDEYASKNSNRKRISKWVRVKKAFLNPVGDEHHKNNSCLEQLKEGVPLYTSTHDKQQIEEEIQDNYKQLQKKLSLEFKGKLHEWEKLKAASACTSSGSHTRTDCVSEEPRDPEFAKKMEEWNKIKAQPTKQTQCTQLVREEDLPPEFKKKLEEWQKIKKSPAKDDLIPLAKSKRKLGEWPRWKSISGHREEHTHNDPQPLSDDFLKKLEEWRKKKDTNKHIDVIEKTPSPITTRKQSLGSLTPTLKPKEGFQWFESELNKIEVERKRLEVERQKFLQREER